MKELRLLLGQTQRSTGAKKSGQIISTVAENIKRLELELAFLSGKLDETVDEEEKEKLNERFLAVARELNKNRELLKL